LNDRARLAIASPLLGLAVGLAGCGRGNELPVGARGAPASPERRASLSNPLKAEGKAPSDALARRLGVPARFGR
jgi:hypothetical protein